MAGNAKGVAGSSGRASDTKTHRVSVATAEVMGTVATFQVVYDGSDTEDSPAAEQAIADFLAAMRADQGIFTTYDESSAIRRLARGELSLGQAPAEVREVEQACRLAKVATQGRFDAWLRGWFDPTGYVKGWSAERAFHKNLEPLIHEAGPIIAVGVNVGGDMQLATRSGADWAWQVGIASPFDKTKMLARFSVNDGAVATSGPGERGAHIIDPKTGQPAASLESDAQRANMVASATVIADNLAMADLWATTAVVAGFKDLDWIKNAGTVSGMLVANDGRIRRWVGPVEIPTSTPNG